MDRRAAKFASRLRRQVIAHESQAGVFNPVCLISCKRGIRVTGCGNRVERTCHCGKCCSATTDPPELIRIEGALKKFFGYNQYQVIGQSQKKLRTGQEDWLATSKFFGLHVDAQGETEAGYVLNLKLYKERELLLETDAKLSKRSPLVIKGPQIGSGQLLLVLVIH